MATSAKKPAVTKSAVKQAAPELMAAAADGEKKAAPKASPKAGGAPAVKPTVSRKAATKPVATKSALNPARAWPFPTGARPK